ncbi:MAG: AAA family ATPase [Deltaproteobacteria bacterium]|nr:AAA family ATPase [Deltaproteobacteria bacterium]
MNEGLSDIDKIRYFQDSFTKIKKEIQKVIIGQERMIDLLLVSLFSDGHSIVMGVPGLAKTTLISTVAKALSLQYSRIQFTPDLMPSDIIGMEILQEDRNTLKKETIFVKGPIFTNILLADEINRSPPKTQSALLQAMQEYNVTIGGRTYEIIRPFIVFATQNPIEQEGTYPLPEAQLDRFLMLIKVDYPSYEEEVEIAKLVTYQDNITINSIIGRDELIEFKRIITKFPIPEHLIKYTVEIGRLSRPSDENPIKEVNEYVRWGVGPRAIQHIIITARTNSILKGKSALEIEDIQDIVPAVLNHRIILNFKAISQKISPENIIDLIIRVAKKRI